MTTDNRKQKNLKLSILINCGIVVFELTFGLLSQSMALISDALHNLTDVGSMILSLWGEKVAARPRTSRKTYGYKRAEVLVAFFNGALLLGMTGWLLLEAGMRLLHPQPVEGMSMLIVATVALIGNGLATRLLKQDAHQDLNLKSAWIHSLQDTLFSLAVIVSGFIIAVSGWNWLDPLTSILVSLCLLKEIFAILSESLALLLDSVPSDLDLEEVRKSLMAKPGVEQVRDLHIWQTGSQERFLSAHLEIAALGNGERNALLSSIQRELADRFKINHPTIQMVSISEQERQAFICVHCN